MLKRLAPVVSAVVIALAIAGAGTDSEARARFAPPLDPEELSKPPRPFLHSGSERPVRAARSSWCWVVPEPGVGMCADYLYEAPRGRVVRADAGGALLLDMRVPTRTLTVVARERASLTAPARRLRAGRERGSSRIWRVRVPRRETELRVIEVFARYPQGDGLFLAPLIVGR